MFFFFAVKVLDSAQFYRHMFHGIKLNQNKPLQIRDLPLLAALPHASRYCIILTLIKCHCAVRGLFQYEVEKKKKKA